MEGNGRQPVVFVGMPMYPGSFAPGLRKLCRGLSQHVPCVTSEWHSSLLANSFNGVWAAALNSRAAHGVTHFAMLHADIEPAEWWIDTLMDEMSATGADIVSVVVPIKDHRGLTSTAIDDPYNPWQPLRRLTMTEAHRLPETFAAEDVGYPNNALLVNTGCWLCKLGPWAERVHFTIQDRIVRKDDGTFEAQVQPEDWNFSRQCRQLGLKVVATRKVFVEHHGHGKFTNGAPWGMYETDDDCLGVGAKSCVPAKASAPEEPPDDDDEDDDLVGFRFPRDVDGWLSEKEGRALARLARGKRVLEIGSYCGRSTICLAQTATRVDAVDPFDGRATPNPRSTLSDFTRNLERYGVRTLVFIHEGEGSCIVPRMVKRRDLFDLAFIDGAHAVESVREDIELALSVLKPEGLLAFHDYQRPGDEGVTQAVDQLLADGGELLETHDSLAVVRPVWTVKKVPVGV